MCLIREALSGGGGGGGGAGGGAAVRTACGLCVVICVPAASCVNTMWLCVCSVEGEVVGLCVHV